MKFAIENLFSKCEQIRRKQRIWLHLLKKSLMEYFIFCAVRPADFELIIWGFYSWLFLKFGSLGDILQ